MLNLKHIFFAVLTFFFLFIVAHGVAAHEIQIAEDAPGTMPVYTEHIDSFDADITVNKDGTIKVVESIVYDFTDLERHGIFRTIPFVKPNEKGKKYEMILQVQSVTDEQGTPYNFTAITVDPDLSVKIGEVDKTISGVHTYVITYTVSGALTYFQDHDELFWNVTGTDWSLIIGKASAVVHLPVNENDTSLDIKTTCYTGSFGSKAQNCQSSFSNGTADFTTTRFLSTFEGLTVAVGFPKGVVAVLEPKEIIAFGDTATGKIVNGALFIGFLLGFIWWYLGYPISLVLRWFASGRDPKGVIGETTAGFEPPNDQDGRTITPGEAGVLLDEYADFEDVSATIVDLARRGYFKIVEKKKDDFYFTETKKWSDDSELLPFELYLLESIFGTEKEVRIKNKKLYEKIEAVKKLLYEQVVADNFFPQNPKEIHDRYNVMAVLAVFTFNLPLLFTAYIFGKNLLKRTQEGVDALNVTKSLLNFLTSQERQLKFQAKHQYMFEKLLPYAVAFGVEDIWSKRFEDLKLNSPEWFEAYDSSSFNSQVFSRSLHSSINTFHSASITSPYTSTSSSTGHSSGFSSSSSSSSGGGGGGGGGGSW